MNAYIEGTVLFSKMNILNYAFVYILIRVTLISLLVFFNSFLARGEMVVKFKYIKCLHG